MDTLLTITGKHTGIVLRKNERPIVCDWSQMHGLPRWFGDEFRGVGEAVPRVAGHYYDDLSEFMSGVSYGSRRAPQRGMIYQINDATIIAPDEWL
jgi:hypothetical protein